MSSSPLRAMDARDSASDAPSHTSAPPNPLAQTTGPDAVTPQIALNASTSVNGATAIPESVARIVADAESSVAQFTARFAPDGDREAIAERFATFLQATAAQIEQRRLEASMLTHEDSPGAERWDKQPLVDQDPSVAMLARDCGRQCAVGAVKKLASAKASNQASFLNNTRESPTTSPLAAPLLDGADRSVDAPPVAELRRFGGSSSSASHASPLDPPGGHPNPTPPSQARPHGSAGRPKAPATPQGILAKNPPLAQGGESPTARRSSQVTLLAEHPPLSGSGESHADSGAHGSQQQERSPGQGLDVADISNFSLAHTADADSMQTSMGGFGMSFAGNASAEAAGRKWLGRALAQALTMFASSVAAQMDLATRLEKMQLRLRQAEAHAARVESNHAIASTFGSALLSFGHEPPGAAGQRRPTLAPDDSASPPSLPHAANGSLGSIRGTGSASPVSGIASAQQTVNGSGRPMPLSSLQLRSPSGSRHPSSSLSPRLGGSAFASAGNSMRLIARALGLGATSGDLALTASVVSAAYAPVARTTKAEVSNDESDGSTMINQYLVLSDLGHGSQGKVVLAVDTAGGETRAIKEIPRPKPVGFRQMKEHAERERNLRREIAVMKKCRHKNVVALYEVIDDPEAHAMYLVMQYIDHGPVATQRADGTVTPIAPARLASFARQLCAGLQYLHNHGVIHRDIKPENILLGQNDQVYLADFGISSLQEPARASASPVKENRIDLSTKSDPSSGPPSPDGLNGNRGDALGSAHAGTPIFQAPELLRESPPRDPLAPPEAVDVWALGLSLFALLFGRLPWALETGRDFLRSVVEDPLVIPKETGTGEALDTEWAVLLGQMLNKNESDRCTAQQAHHGFRALDGKYQKTVGDGVPDEDIDTAITQVRRGHRASVEPSA
uniref:Protein kinase domain-containing protein n=1 Tax=Neobodo designis TaxID=312471 RepID=A0A7S1W0U5_NEODS|mmetsp:Transcript_48223/g.148790  ORF Transcript_48223/g.148790 Transcript_48223/m.148790 type:complete len:906 (+) Transcript_48223:62-2779(+)